MRFSVLCMKFSSSQLVTENSGYLEVNLGCRGVLKTSLIIWLMDCRYVPNGTTPYPTKQVLLPGLRLPAFLALTCWGAGATVTGWACVVPMAPGGPTRSIWYWPVSVLTSRWPGWPVGIPWPACRACGRGVWHQLDKPYSIHDHLSAQFYIHRKM